MAVRKPKTRKIPPPPQSRSEILCAIGDALREWAKFNGTGSAQAMPISDAEKKVAREALQLMEDNLWLLNECRSKYGIRFPLGVRLNSLETAKSWPDPTDLGDDENWKEWREAFTRPGPSGQSFINEVGRWRSKESREKPWDDNDTQFILISEARQKYCLSLGAPTLAVLGRDHCKPDGEFDFMRRGQRRKVHEQEFVAYADRRGWTRHSMIQAQAFIDASQKPRTRLGKARREWDMDWNSEDQ
ncbi:MAG: hypothetical protein RBR19_19670 [Sedimentisphaerales bacterium]|jgi:hypothetical protein|nr:hypothetical protein [Sedimentisphaerales bacterium]NLT78269.1 hypothetical protein [Planctomycetota bacterium]